MNWKHVAWKPVSPTGDRWVAYHDGNWQGRVVRIGEFRYEARRGARYRVTGSMKDAGRLVVAYVNNIYPSQLPR